MQLYLQKNLSDKVCYFQWELICRKSNLFCFLSQMTVEGNLFEIFHDGILLKFPEPRWRHMLEWGVNIIYLSVSVSISFSSSGFCYFYSCVMFELVRSWVQLHNYFFLEFIMTLDVEMGYSIRWFILYSLVQLILASFLSISVLLTSLWSLVI